MENMKAETIVQAHSEAVVSAKWTKHGFPIILDKIEWCIRNDDCELWRRWKFKALVYEGYPSNDTDRAFVIDLSTHLCFGRFSSRFHFILRDLYFGSSSNEKSEALFFTKRFLSINPFMN